MAGCIAINMTSMMAGCSKGCTEGREVAAGRSSTSGSRYTGLKGVKLGGRGIFMIGFLKGQMDIFQSRSSITKYRSQYHHYYGLTQCSSSPPVFWGIVEVELFNAEICRIIRYLEKNHNTFRYYKNY